MSTQKRKKNYFTSSGNNQKRWKQLSLEPGMTGFLCTSNIRERECIRDAYKILNEFADEIYGQEFVKEDKLDDKNKELTDESKNDDNDGDISAALSKELSELKAEYAKPVGARRFQVIDTGVKNVIFIKTTVPDPLEIVTKIITELDKTKKQRTRFLLRLLPIEAVCKAYMDDIKATADKLFDKHFVEAPKTFSIVFSRHCNNNIHRDEVVEELARMVLKKHSGNKADLKNPEIAVVVDVLRGLCLLSIAPHYYKYRKYNLVEICNPKARTENKKTTEATEEPKTEEEVKEEAIDKEESAGNDDPEELKDTKPEDQDKEEATDKKENTGNDAPEELKDTKPEDHDKEEAIDKEESAGNNDPEESKDTKPEDQDKAEERVEVNSEAVSEEKNE